MKRQIVNWEEDIKPLFPTGTLEFIVETPFFRGRYVNLDNAATTSAFKFVEEAVQSVLISYGSIHRGSGQKSKISTDGYEQARGIIGEFVGATSEHYVLFTKNTTEAINHAAALFAGIPGKVLVSDIEHSSNLLPWLRHGEVVQYKTMDDGVIDDDDIVKVLKENAGKTGNDQIKLLAITGASNVTGYKPNIHYLALLAHQFGVKILVDACQLVPHERINMMPEVYPEHIDFITFSGHKMYAPFGVGVLVGSKSFFDQSSIYQIGGGNLPYITRDLQIKRFRTAQAHEPGTPNFLGAIALAAAVKILTALERKFGYKVIAQYEAEIVREAHRKIKEIPTVELYVREDKLGSIIPFDIRGIPHHLTAEILSQEYGIGVRAGSFCTYEIMRTLKNVSAEEDKTIAEDVDRGITRNIPGIVRASFGLVNKREDVDRFVTAVSEIAQHNLTYYAHKYHQDSKTGRWSLHGE